MKSTSGANVHWTCESENRLDLRRGVFNFDWKKSDTLLHSDMKHGNKSTVLNKKVVEPASIFSASLGAPIAEMISLNSYTNLEPMM